MEIDKGMSECITFQSCKSDSQKHKPSIIGLSKVRYKTIENSNYLSSLTHLQCALKFPVVFPISHFNEEKYLNGESYIEKHPQL